MKIGTDGVLLGAWANAENPLKVLDIGTGTGLILLMLAQRFPAAGLTGIEIDENASSEAEFNINQSKFKDRCSVFHSSVQEFESEKNFDLIVSNPPFFELTHKEISSRNMARQQSELSFDELLFNTKRLLNVEGKAAFIIPFNSEPEFLRLAERHILFPEKIMHIKGKGNSPVKRSLISLSQSKTQTTHNELIIEVSRNVYTKDYTCLTKDFYLKM